MRKTILFLLGVLLSICVQAQKFNTLYTNVSIDTVYLFSPFGYITTMNQNQRQISPEFTKSIGDTLQKLVIEKFPPTSIILGDSMIKNDYKTQDNIIVTLDKIKKIDDGVFSMIPTGSLLDSMVSKYPGRYFGFVYYSGFMNNQVKHTMATSITLMIVTSVLTAGMFTMFLIPIPSEIDAKFLIIDKMEHKFVYFSDKIQTKSYTMDVNRHKLVDKLLKKYKKSVNKKI